MMPSLRTFCSIMELKMHKERWTRGGPAEEALGGRTPTSIKDDLEGMDGAMGERKPTSISVGRGNA